jgi:hypothetical protein
MFSFYQWFEARMWLENKIKAYHGTDHEFDTFDPDKIGRATDAGMLGHGFYFSTDQAIGRNNKYTKIVSLTLHNPLKIKMPAWETNKKKLITIFLEISPQSTSQAITAKAKRLGYDGVILDYSELGYNHQEIVVWDQSQIEADQKVKLKQ